MVVTTMVVATVVMVASSAEPKIHALGPFTTDDQVDSWQHIDRITWPKAPEGVGELAEDPAQQVVVLADGGWLPAQVSGFAGADQLTIRGDVLRDEYVTMLLGDCVGWGDPNLLAQLIQSQQDVIWTQQGQLLGQVLGSSEKGLKLQHAELGLLELGLEQIRACYLALPARRVAPNELRWSWSVHSHWPALALQAAGMPRQNAAIGWSTVAGSVALNVTYGTVWVEGPQRRWLADLTPLTVDEQGAFGRVWPWQRNANLLEGPLSLGGVVARSGICVHSAATLSWSVPPQAQRLRAHIGIEDSVAPEGNCLVSIELDDKVVWQQEIVGYEDIVPIDIDVSGGRVLVLRVDLGERYDIGDHVALANAFFSIRTDG